jgi:protein SCO1/2
MPPLSISSNDANDLLAYIAHLEDKTRRAGPANLVDYLAALTTHEGTRLAADRIRGQPTVVTFGFTHCPDVCPTTLLDWTNALAGLGPDGDRLKVLFVSVDNERDTPEALKAYMASFDPRIVALTGSSTEIAAAASAFDAQYEKVPAGASFTYDHTVKSYLVDRSGKLVGTLDLQTPEAHRNEALSKLLAQE